MLINTTRSAPSVSTSDAVELATKWREAKLAVDAHQAEKKRLEAILFGQLFPNLDEASKTLKTGGQIIKATAERTYKADKEKLAAAGEVLEMADLLKPDINQTRMKQLFKKDPETFEILAKDADLTRGEIRTTFTITQE